MLFEGVHQAAAAPFAGVTESASERVVSLRDDSGRWIADVAVQATEDGRAMVLHLASGNGRLLSYFFGNGGRRVSVALDGSIEDGQLETRWLGSGRLWIMRLDRAAKSDAPAQRVARH